MLNREIFLFDGGKDKQNTHFSIKEDSSGINLESFEMDDRVMTVEEILHYKPWMWGKVNPGAGQMEIYRLRDRKRNLEQIALIKDYRDNYGKWCIAIQGVADTEAKMRDELMMNPLGATFPEFLLSH